MLPVGIRPDLEIASTNVQFGPGDVLLAMTDGVTESPAFSEKPYEKLQALLEGKSEAGAQEITETVFSRAVPDETENPSDDIVVICIKRLE